MPPLTPNVWRHAVLRLRLARHAWIDLLLVLGVAGLLFGLVDLVGEATAAHRPTVEIDLSPWALPRYTFYSLTRGLTAYVLSLAFTLVYGYWAAKDRAAERVLLPLLDVLQSIPVLSFLPAFVILLVSLFPGSNIGLELAAVLIIFTGQVWNMVFSFYHSLRSIPRTSSRSRPSSASLLAEGKVGRAAVGGHRAGLEQHDEHGRRLGVPDRSSRPFTRRRGLPPARPRVVPPRGPGDRKTSGAMVWGVLAMVLMIVGLDQLLWRPVVVWAQKFRVEDDASGPAAESWVLNWLRRSRLIRATGCAGGVGRRGAPT